VIRMSIVTGRQHRARWRLLSWRHCLRRFVAVTTIGQRGQMQRAAPREVTPRGDLLPTRRHHRAFQKAKPSVVYIDTRARGVRSVDAERVQLSEGTGSDSFGTSAETS